MERLSRGKGENSYDFPRKPRDFTRSRAESFIKNSSMSSDKKLEWLASEEIALKFEYYLTVRSFFGQIGLRSRMTLLSIRHFHINKLAWTVLPLPKHKTVKLI